MAGILSLVAIAVGVVMGLFMPQAKKAKQASMSPANLDSFSVSTTDEGAVVPLIMGTVRINSNILYYGNLRTEEVYETVKGGKGGSRRQKVVTGYQYWLDLWHGIARGPIEIVSMYADDKPKTPTGMAFNNGTGNYFPGKVGGYATKLPGIAHAFFDQYDLGVNKTHVPTFHFIVRDQKTFPFANAHLDSGINPAAAIYWILTEAGATEDQFNLDGFQKAANRYAAKGYGLNLSYTQRQKTRDCIESIINYAGGYFTEMQSAVGTRYNIKVPDRSDPIAAVLSDDDYASFKMERVSQDKMPNVLTAKFMDETQDFTQRVIICKNTAAVAHSGRIDKSIDLTAFRTHASAQKRLAELLRDLSYPTARFIFELSLKYSSLEIGDLIDISHSEWGVSGLKARITHIEQPGPEVATYTFQAELDPLFIQDANFTLPDYAPQWEQPEYNPQDLLKVRLFELPRTPLNYEKPALAILAARQIGVETGCGVLWAHGATDYELLGQFSTFCQCGYLSGAYPATTYDIDDELGLIYTPWRDDPQFNPISRDVLFNFKRLALVDNELMAFSGVELTGPDKIKLTGVVRGVYGTQKAAHANNAAIWIIPVQENLIFTDLPQSGNLKLLPFFGDNMLDEGLATARAYSLSYKAAAPFSVGRIMAVRSGGTVSITWWPCDIDPFGAGVKAEDYTDQYPFIYSGDFLYRIGSANGAYTDIDATTLQVTQTGSFTFNVRARQNGELSAIKTLSVGAADGTYII